MNFDNYRYIYPPRPKNAINPNDLSFWDDGTLLAQPKLNGSNTTIYTDGVQMIVMNRHNQRLSNFKINKEEILNLHRGDKGKWMVINGEYMNKGKFDEVGKNFNDKFVIFDILVKDSIYLIGKTFSERNKIIEDLYDCEYYNDGYISKISDNVFKVSTYYKDFKFIFSELVKVDMMEGLVLKRKSAKLEIGNTENNNTKSQIKSRKPTKNYKY